MGKDEVGVVPVDIDMACNTCSYFFTGDNLLLCPSCGSDDIGRLPAQKIIIPSEKLVRNSPHYGYGEL